MSIVYMYWKIESNNYETNKRLKPYYIVFCTLWIIKMLMNNQHLRPFY